MPHAVPSRMAATGLQALILCGPGSSFPTFTSNPEEHPKALLPVANRPMVWYALDFCYRMGVTDITLITPPSAENALSTAMTTNPYLTNLPSPKAGILAPKDLDFNTGTAQILRLPEVRAEVKSDFVVLPCDLVCELGGEKLLRAWMDMTASLPDLLGASRRESQHSGGLGVWYQTKTETPIKGLETDFVATVPIKSPPIPTPKDSLLPHITKVVYSMPKDTLKDLQEEKGGLPIRHALIRKHPRIRMLATYRDAHIYIFPHWVLDFVEQNDKFDTIGEDVLGWWAKATWQNGLPTKLGLGDVFDKDEKNSARDGSESPGPESPSQLRVEPEPSNAQTVVSVRDKKGQPEAVDDILPRLANEEIPPLMAYVQPPASAAPLIRRVDTAQLLLQTSLILAKLPSVEEVGPDAASPFAHQRKVAYPEGVKTRTTITKADSLVGESVTVEEKSSIKESVVGANCQIGEGSKLMQCLLMDGVVIGKNCKLTKCVLGRRCEVKDGCTLTDCEVQENLLVEPKTEAKNEKLMSSSGLDATEEEFQEALEAGDGL